MAISTLYDVVIALEGALKNGSYISYELPEEVQLSKTPELWPALTKLVQAGHPVIVCASDSPDGESYQRRLETTDVWAEVHIFINEIVVTKG